MKKKIVKTSFFNKLLMFQIVFIISVVGIVSFVTCVFLSERILDNEKMHLEQLLQVVNESISSHVETFNSAGFDLIINEELKENLNKTDSIEYGRAVGTILGILSNRMLSTNGIENILIIDKCGHYYSTNFALLLPADFAYEKTKVYLETKNGSGDLIWLSENDIYNLYGTLGMYKNTSNIHAAAVLKNYSTGEEMGILILSVRNGYFEKMKFGDERIKGTKLYLVSPDKVEAYKVSGTEEDLDEEVLEELAFSDDIKSTFSVGNKIVSYRYNANMGWYLVSVTDESYLRNSIRGVMMMLLGILGLSIIIFIFAAHHFSKKMTKGMDVLLDGMRRLEAGDFTTKIQYKGEDEFGKLANAFNYMVKQINDLVISKYQQELLVREAEFYALQSQINPHFLYNTLDMLRWQMQGRGMEDLSKSVVAIGKMLRYSFSQGNQNVSLQMELENIQDYLSIQFLINKREIQVTVDAEDAEQILLPRLSLQPLAENAISHGFKGRERGNILTITGRYLRGGREKEYILEIKDNGVGIEKEDIEKLNNMKEDREEHIGIYNVRKRIDYLYGGRSEMTITSEYGFGTKVVIRFWGAV